MFRNSHGSPCIKTITFYLESPHTGRVGELDEAHRKARAELFFQLAQECPGGATRNDWSEAIYFDVDFVCHIEDLYDFLWNVNDAFDLGPFTVNFPGQEAYDPAEADYAAEYLKRYPLVNVAR